MIHVEPPPIVKEDCDRHQETNDLKGKGKEDESKARQEQGLVTDHEKHARVFLQLLGQHVLEAQGVCKITIERPSSLAFDALSS